MYFVYILSSIKHQKSYVGCTDNLERRIKEHNAGKMNFTKIYKPWSLIHSEIFDSLSNARKRESYLKSGAGRRFMKSLFK